MKLTLLKSKKFWWRIAAIILLFPLLLFCLLLLVVYSKQDALIQGELLALNKTYKGELKVGDTHLEPFANFPYISIKIDDVSVYESKELGAERLLNVADIYAGFNIWDLLSGNYDIKDLIIEEGYLNLILHEDGTLNLQNALTTNDTTVSDAPLDIHLQKITLKNLDIHKFDETTNVDVETFIYNAEGGFQTSGDLINAHIDTEFELNVIDNGDTTYINKKHFEFHTDLAFNSKSQMLDLKPSGIKMEHGDFDLVGAIDLKNEVTLDLSISGKKSNFDMLIAFAPSDLIPVLERYKNAGDIYFNAIVKGPTLHGVMPFIDVKFGANEAFLENIGEKKRIDNLGFKGHFTNGKNRNLETMAFSITGMGAKLETGNFIGSVSVKNFENPEVDMELNADFNVGFLTKFLNLKDLEASGSAQLEMRFHDIVDLDRPELALNDLNQAYFSELKIQDLSLQSSDLPVPLEDLDMHLIMNGKEAVLDLFDMEFGNSDLSIQGAISDLPAIVHHSSKPVLAHLEIRSKTLDLSEITKYSKQDSSGIDERIENLDVGFSFKSSARAFTESEHLPVGEFFIDNLHAELKHYPHELHDFHVDLLIGDEDLKIKDFTGFIDGSDFHLNGLAHDYGFWMKDVLDGDVDLDLTLNSDLLRLEDLFSYGGENYVPKDYRHEEVDGLILHLKSSMHYKASSLQSLDLTLDRLTAKMHVHPMRFENFSGRFHYEDEHLMVKDFKGKLGRTVFDLDINYYFGNNPRIRKRDNHIGLKANYIDFDQLFNFQLPSQKPQATLKRKSSDLQKTQEHREVFNIYELPFTAMTIDADVGHFIYHRIDLQKIHARLRTTENHFVYVDTLDLAAAGGNVRMSGYFNGSDAKHIYLKPKLKLENVSMDKLMFKFENFGQDALVSENLHGKLNTLITGKIRVYPDMVPNLDQSEIHMDLQVIDGRLENYEYMSLLADYFGDKNLNSVRFDTLQNHMDITNGLLTIPKMTIESTLGHFEISGTQDLQLNMEYFLRIPWSVIKQGARNKVFGTKQGEGKPLIEDEIIEVDPKRKTKYLNLKIKGNLEDYKITLGKQKE